MVESVRSHRWLVCPEEARRWLLCPEEARAAEPGDSLGTAGRMMQRVNETKFRKFVPNSREDLKFTKHYVALDFRLSGVLLVEVVHTRMSSPRPCHFFYLTWSWLYTIPACPNESHVMVLDSSSEKVSLQ